MCFKLIVLIFTVFLGTVKTLYDESASYVFQVFGSQTPKSIIRSFLSANKDQLILFYSGINDIPYLQEKYSFNGTKICSRDLQATQKIIGWPFETQGVYTNSNEVGIISRTTENCGIPTKLIQLSTDFSFTYRNTNQASYGAFLTDNKTITQYDLKTGNKKIKILGTFYRNLTLKADQEAKGFVYSNNFKYLYVQTNKTVIIYDVELFERINEINCDLKLYAGDSDGNGFIAYVTTGPYFYHFDHDGIRTLIYNYPLIPVLGACTDQNILVSIHLSTTNFTFNVITFDGKQRNVLQNFSLGSFAPLSVQCNNKYLQILDINGTSHIFKYNQPQPDDDKDSSLPTWALVIIIFVSVLILGSVFRLIVRKIRKQKSQRSQNQYQNLV